MGVPKEELDKILKNRGAAARPTLLQRGARAVGGAVGAVDRGIKSFGGDVQAVTSQTPRQAGQGVANLITGASNLTNPLQAALGEGVERLRPIAAEFSAGLTGREPGQPAANIVQPPQVGAVTQDAIQAIPQETQPLLPTTGAGVGTRAAPRGGATDASRFLNTVSGNRQAAIDAGGIQVIRGLRSSIDLPAQSRFGSQIIPESQFQPGGFEGRARIAAAGGSPALAQSIESREGAVESARLRSNAVVAASVNRAAGGADEDQSPTTDAGIVEQINFRLATGTDAEGNPLDETSIATLLANKKRIQLNNPSLALQ